jgi:hypothetical protein
MNTNAIVNYTLDISVPLLTSVHCKVVTLRSIDFIHYCIKLLWKQDQSDQIDIFTSEKYNVYYTVILFLYIFYTILKCA